MEIILTLEYNLLKYKKLKRDKINCMLNTDPQVNYLMEGKMDKNLQMFQEDL